MSVDLPGIRHGAAVIDGAEIARQIQAEVHRDAQDLHRSSGITPGLAVVLTGSNPAALNFAGRKEQACEETGLFCRVFNFPEDIPGTELAGQISRLNGDARFHGILLQTPFPKQIDAKQLAQALDPRKDIDCMHPANVRLLVAGKATFAPATALAVLELLGRANVPLQDTQITVCGKADSLSTAIVLLLAQAQRRTGSMTSCYEGSHDLARSTCTADILVACTDRPAVIKADMVKKGAVVIDASLVQIKDASRERGYRIAGGVDFGPASKVAGAITRVPGGVGPVTIATLMANTVKAARLATGKES